MDLEKLLGDGISVGVRADLKSGEFFWLDLSLFRLIFRLNKKWAALGQKVGPISEESSRVTVARHHPAAWV